MKPRKLLVRDEKNDVILLDRINGIKKHFDDKATGDEVHRISLPQMGISSKALGFPLRAYIGINNLCNLDCRMCYAKGNEPDIPIQLRREEWLPVFDILEKYGLVEIRIGESGEPTLNGGLLTDFLNDAKAEGFYVSLTTNGQFDGKWCDAWSRLVDQPIFSIDGSREYHDWNRGDGTYDKVVDNLKRFKGRTKELRINTILSRRTVGGLENLIRLGVDNGVSELCLLQLRPYNKGRKHWEDVFTPEEWDRFINETIPFYRQKFPGFYIRPDYDTTGKTRPDRLVDKVTQCSAGTEAFGIRPVSLDGERRLKIYGCGYLCDEGDDFVAATITPEEFEIDFLRIWHDDTRWSVFRNPRRNEQCVEHCDHYAKRCFGQCTAMLRYAQVNKDFEKYLSCPFANKDDGIESCKKCDEKDKRQSSAG
jgi:MoaA/NifB/PqqE/SkfB family radical SAM enzyme